MSKSNYEEVRKLYEMCKEKIYYLDDVSEFIKKAENEEEKEFYAIKKGVF
jgi:predicted GNAT family acetyltransferase